MLLVLLHPVRNISEAVSNALLGRVALAKTGAKGMATIAEGVASSAVSVHTASYNPVGVQSIRSMVLNTGGQAYAAAALALQQSGHLDVSHSKCKTVLIGGQEDYLASQEMMKAWAAELPCATTDVHILKDVGHWAAVEAPGRLGKLLRTILDHR